METLPRQHANGLSALWSLNADNQMRTALEAGLAATLGTGVLAKGRVTKTAALACEVETGTQFFCEGVALTLGSAASYSGLTASQTNYLWGLVTRTARDRATPTAEDGWALALSHNTTGVAPTALSIPMATLLVPSASITGIDNAPAGKYLQRPGSIRETIPSGAVECIDSGYQVNARGPITVRGTLYVRGHYYIRGNG